MTDCIIDGGAHGRDVSTDPAAFQAARAVEMSRSCGLSSISHNIIIFVIKINYNK